MRACSSAACLISRGVYVLAASSTREYSLTQYVGSTTGWLTRCWTFPRIPQVAILVLENFCLTRYRDHQRSFRNNAASLSLSWCRCGNIKVKLCGIRRRSVNLRRCATYLLIKLLRSFITVLEAWSNKMLWYLFISCNARISLFKNAIISGSSLKYKDNSHRLLANWLLKR